MENNLKLMPIGRCGIHDVKFAPKTGENYATALLELPFILGLTLNSKVEPVEVYASDELQLNIPSDTGYEGELNATAPDPALDKAAGLTIEGATGLIGVDMTLYAYGALYFEHTQYPKNAPACTVKVWLLNVEIGKGSESFTTKKKSPEMGNYAYPLKVLGDTLMAFDGLKPALDENGMRHKSFRLTRYPGETGYDTFGEAVPVPKVAGNPPPPSGG